MDHRVTPYSEPPSRLEAGFSAFMLAVLTAACAWGLYGFPGVCR